MVKIAMDLLHEGMHPSSKTAILRCEPQQLDEAYCTQYSISWLSL